MKIKKKILKNFFIQYFLALFAFFYIYLVKLTSSVDYENQNIPKKYWNKQSPFILAFWHSQLMMISYSWKINKKLNILASGHSDGRFGAKVGSYFKLENIQTSKKNSNLSLRTIYNLIKNNNYLGITPDGPRGPKENVSEGIIKIAKNLQIPIIPIGFWSSKNFKLNSWDSFLITLPFSKCSFVWNDPLKIPKKIDENEMKKYQKLLEKKIKQSVNKAKNNCL